MTQETPRNHDHSSRGSGGKELRPELVSTEYVERAGTPEGTDRPLFTTEGETLTVDASGGAGYTSIQAALDDIPLFVLHPFGISIAPGDYTNEGDLVVPPHTTSYIDRADGSEQLRIGINGDRATPSNVKTGAWHLDHCTGYALNLAGFDVAQSSVATNEDSGVFAMGCGHVHTDDMVFSASDFGRAIVAYGGTQLGVAPRGAVDLTGTTNVYIATKHGGSVYFNDTSGGDVTASTGTVSSQVLRTSNLGGPMHFNGTVSCITNPRDDIVAVGGPAWYGGIAHYPEGRTVGTYTENPVSSGTGQTFDTGIPAYGYQSSLLLVSFKRDGSARMDTELILCNTGGAAGSDESAQVFRSDNSAQMTNVVVSASGTTFDVTADFGTSGQLHIIQVA